MYTIKLIFEILSTIKGNRLFSTNILGIFLLESEYQYFKKKL